MRLSRFVSRGRFFGSKVTGLSLALVIAAFGAVDAAAQNTGTVTGLGRDAARALAKGGADLALVARRADRLEELAKEIHDEFGVQTLALPADPQQLEQAIEFSGHALLHVDVSQRALDDCQIAD